MGVVDLRADPRTDLRARVEKRVNEGLRGLWYVVAKSSDVQPGKLHAATMMGTNLVLWRDGAGALQCLEDFCPHRGARLSRGAVDGDTVACRYHGIRLDGTGRIVQVPAMPECALEGRQGGRAFTVREHADAVFAYFPSADAPEPSELTLPYELTDGDHATFLCTAVWGCNYRYALDNLADPMHGCYLHSDSFTLALGAKQDLMRVDPCADGFIATRVGQRGANFDWTEIVTDQPILYCRLDIPYPQAAGPGGPMRIVTFVTPIDETSCRIFFYRTRKVAGLEREVWKFMYRTLFEPRHWAVLEQDREMLIDMPDDARRREMLYQHDVGVSRIRQVLHRKAKAQVQAEMADLAEAS